jgi:hypothetical protein
VNERLATETRIHAHHKNVVNQWKNFVEDMDGRTRVYHYAGLRPMRSDETKRAIKMGASFLVNRDPIDSYFSQYRDKFVGVFDHQVTVEGNRRHLAESGDNRRPDREIGDEVAVHYVKVQNGRSTLNGSLSLRAEAREISRENRSGKVDRTIALVHQVSTRGSRVIRLCSRDFLDHAVGNSFPSHSADSSGLSFALHDGQPSNAPCEHGRECHGGRIVQCNRERIPFHQFTKFVLHQTFLLMRWSDEDARDNLKEVTTVESSP